MFRKSAIPGWSVWACIPLSIGMAWFIHSLGFRTIEASLQQIPGYKFTFVSVLLAVGMFQYNYFYSQAEKLGNAVDDENYGPAWSKYIEDTNDLRRLIEEVAEHLGMEKAKANLQFRDKQIAKVVDWHHRTLRRVIIDGCVRFILIFAVGLDLLISLVLDIIALLQMPMRFDPAAISQSFLFSALGIFACLFCFFILSFSLEVTQRMSRIVPPGNNG